MSVFDDLAAEQDRLAEILSGPYEAQWLSPSGSVIWVLCCRRLPWAQEPHEQRLNPRVQADALYPGIICNSPIPGGCSL
jgi:hypothetical protein